VDKETKYLADAIYWVESEFAHFIAHHPDFKEESCALDLKNAIDDLIRDWRIYTKQDV